MTRVDVPGVASELRGLASEIGHEYAARKMTATVASTHSVLRSHTSTRETRETSDAVLMRGPPPAGGP
jgi:hypothetical protein